MSTRKRLLVAAGGIVVGGFFALSIACKITCIGDLGLRDSLIASAHAEGTLDLTVWRSGDQAARGRMLAALAEQYRFRGFHRDSVESILGRGECYADYEDVPCYQLRLGHSNFA